MRTKILAFLMTCIAFQAIPVFAKTLHSSETYDFEPIRDVIERGLYDTNWRENRARLASARRGVITDAIDSDSALEIKSAEQALSKIADTGDKDALELQFALYSQGIKGAVPRNNNRASKTLIKCAEAGSSNCQLIAAHGYEFGFVDLPRDHDKARKYYNLNINNSESLYGLLRLSMHDALRRESRQEYISIAKRLLENEANSAEHKFTPNYRCINLFAFSKASIIANSIGDAESSLAFGRKALDLIEKTTSSFPPTKVELLNEADALLAHQNCAKNALIAFREASRLLSDSASLDRKGMAKMMMLGAKVELLFGK